MVTIKKRSHGQKINQEQEIATIMHKATDLAVRYQKPLTVAVAVLAAVIVIAGIIQWYRADQEKRAAPLVAAAYELYSPANAADPDYGKALEQFRSVQKKYGSTMSGAISQYYAANCLMNLGRADEALQEYQAFLAQHAGEKLLASLVHLRMGYLYHALGNFPEAEKSFDRAEVLSGPGVATIEIARLQAKTGNTVASQQKYKVIQEKLGGTAWGIEAMGRLQALTPGLPAAPTTQAQTK